MTLWTKKFIFGWPLLLGLLSLVFASVEVLESPNSLDGENHLEETVTDEELLDMTNGTEPLAEDSFTTISGDPMNVTEQFANQTDIVGNENTTTSVSENVTIVEPVTERVDFRTNLENEDPTLFELHIDSSTNETTTENFQSSTNLADQNSSASQFNETGPPVEWLISPHEKDLGQIRNLSSNATVPEPTLYEINTNRTDSVIPDGLQSAIPTVRHLENTESSMVTQTPHDCSKHEKSLLPEWWYKTYGRMAPVSDNVSSVVVDTRSLELENSRNSTMPPATLIRSRIQPRQLLVLNNIPKVTVPTTSTPKTTTKQKIGFRSKTLPKKPTAKTTRKSKVRSKVVVKSNAKATKKARSARKVLTVVKRRFRKVLRTRRATTTRLVFRRRRRTTRLVRKTTTALSVVE